MADQSRSRKYRQTSPCLNNHELEERALLAQVQVLQAPSFNSQFPKPSNNNPNSKNFVRLGNGFTNITVRARKVISYSANGGMGTVIQDIDGEKWVAWVNSPLEPRSTAGVIRAYPDSGGRVKLVVDGTNENSELIIEPFARYRPRNKAEQFSVQVGRQDNLLHVSDIMITSGKIGSILGYRTADLSGTVTIPGTTSIWRIALNSIQPGGSIITGGDLNTLNVYNDAIFDGGVGLKVGRDLNWMTVHGNLEFRNGADFIVGRDIGLNTQPAKGTSEGGAGAYVSGNTYISATSTFQVGRSLDNVFLTQGRFDGVNHVSIPSGSGNLIAYGGFYPTP